jgi:hypothetical protein
MTKPTEKVYLKKFYIAIAQSKNPYKSRFTHRRVNNP